MILAEAFTELLKDPAHWMMEGISEVASYLIFGLLFGKWLLKRHDRKVHAKPEVLPTLTGRIITANDVRQVPPPHERRADFDPLLGDLRDEYPYAEGGQRP